MGQGKITLDDIFHRYIGEVGYFQLGIFLFLGLSAFCGVELIFMNFLSIEVPHVCEVPEIQNLTFSQQQYIVAPAANSEDATTYSQCQIYNYSYSSFTLEEFETWNRTEMLQKYRPNTYSCDSFVFNISHFSGSQVQKWLLVCDQKWLVDLISTITVGGCFVGAFLGGALADKYGRRKGLIMCAFVKLIGNVAAVFSPNYYMFCVARFFVGFGSTSVYLVAFVLLVELVGSRYRNAFSIGYSILYSLGFMFLPLAAYLTKDAFLFHVVVVSPMLFTILYLCVIPESPHWLLLHKKKMAALAVLKRIASVNRRSLPENFDVTEIVTNVSHSSSMPVPKSTCCDLLATPVIRIRSLVLFFDWFTVSLIFYALSLNAGTLVGDIYLNTFLLGLVEIPANLIAMWSLNVRAIGRRWTHVVAFFIAGLACLLCVPIIETGKVLWLSTVFAMVGKAGSTAAFNGLYLYTSELYPTQVRNLGMGACSAMARISGMVASYAGGSLAGVWKPLPSIIFGTFGTLSGMVTIILPETLNTTLLETVVQVEDTIPKYSVNAHEDVENEPLLKES